MSPPRPRKIRAPRSQLESLLVVHATELLTLRGPRAPRTQDHGHDLDILSDGALYAEGERIVDVGPTDSLLARHPRPTRILDATGKVVMPGFVDAHTHAIFAGFREREVEWKSQGLTYEEIARRGGGIPATVQATRAASEEELARLGADRLAAMLTFGTTTVEVKSGYGLRTDDELRMLRAARKAGERAGVDVVTTFMGAHAVPSEFEGKSEAYVDLLVHGTLPRVASEHLATFCDVFVERGYFTREQGMRLLTAARAYDLRAKVHADELSDSGGAGLAAELQAISADHLLHVSTEGIEAMRRAGVIGVLLPATSLVSRFPFADGRRLHAAGVPLALGTDFSPNCWCESMQLVAALAAHHNGLTPAQTIVGATINAAHAVGRSDQVGSLEPGKLADLLVLGVPSIRHLGYRIGSNLVETVVKRGRVVRPQASMR